MKKFMDYIKENALFFVGAACAMSGSQYEFFKYLAPSIEEMNKEK